MINLKHLSSNSQLEINNLMIITGYLLCATIGDRLYRYSELLSKILNLNKVKKIIFRCNLMHLINLDSKFNIDEYFDGACYGKKGTLVKTGKLT